MCLVRTKDTKEFTATKDIVVYKETGCKLTDELFVSAYTNYLYKTMKPNKIYVRPTVSIGYHSYLRSKDCRVYKDRIGIFLIPAGSKVIKGLFTNKECYVSNNIIYLGRRKSVGCAGNLVKKYNKLKNEASFSKTV